MILRSMVIYGAPNDRRYIAARHGLTSADYQTVFDQQNAAGFSKRTAQLTIAKNGRDQAGPCLYLGSKHLPRHATDGPFPVSELQQDVPGGGGAVH